MERISKDQAQTKVMETKKHKESVNQNGDSLKKK
jgi:hypothetical protein